MTLICRYKEFKCFHFSQKWKGDLENSWSFRFIYHGLLTGRCQWILICHALKENWSPVFLVSKNSNILYSIREEEQVSIEFSESAIFLIACLVMKKAIPANLGIVIKLRTCISALIASCMSLLCFAFSLPGSSWLADMSNLLFAPLDWKPLYIGNAYGYHEMFLHLYLQTKVFLFF